MDPESKTGASPDDESDLLARTRDLDLIQRLGRRAAEARSPADLFAITFSELAGVERMDVIAVAHELDEDPELLLFRGRPLSDGCVETLLATAAALLDCRQEKIGERWNELEGFDPLEARRESLGDEDLTVLPLLRRGQPAAYVLLAQTESKRGSRLPLWYNAANQLTVHLDRVLGLREHEADRFRAILESMPQAVLLLDGQLRIRQLNRAAIRLRSELELAPEADGSAWLEHFGLDERIEPLLDGSEDIIRDEVACDPGREFNVTVTPVEDVGDPGRGLVCVLTDVGETRRLQRKLELSERMSSLGQMISGVAHELNNPLSTILGYAQLLGRTETDERTSRRLATLADEAQRCRRIVENLLSFARRRDPERRPVSLNEVVQSVEALMRYQLRVENIRLDKQLDPDLPPLLADRHELQQLLVNLVTNARHAIRSKGGEGAITLTTAGAPGGAIRLEVSDTGCGVDPSIRDSMFEPFVTSKGEGEGTGLGLALVNGIVRGHDGTIELLDTGDAGSTFRITLPVAARGAFSHAPAAEPRADAPFAARIMVVDDEPSFARVVCEALSEDGHHVCAVDAGAQALERFREEPWDLVISDMRMPGMSGLELKRELERIRPGGGRRLLLITGDTVSEDALRAGTDEQLATLHKPFELDQLRAAVRGILTA